jgi:hypothetical protein
MPICKNCGGSNKKVVLNYTPKSYTICPDPGICPESYGCSEILDSACIQYTSDNILYCGTSFVVINKFESLENALQEILDILCQTPPRCALDVAIIPNPNDENTPSLTTSVSNGLAPYTYKWEIAQEDFVGHIISGSSTSSSLNLTCIGAKAIRTGSVDKNIKISNIQLTVTDAKGCKETVHFLYTSDCYPMVVSDSQPRQAFLGGRLFNNNGYETPFAYVPMDFMDNPIYMPLCPELKNICCIDGYPSYEDASSTYRANRDQYNLAVNQNSINENVGSPEPTTPLDYTQWEPGNLGDQLIFYKGGLMNYNILWGCPECTFRIWTEIPWPALANQTLAERFSMLDPEDCTKFYWIDAVPFGNTPPTGQPGQLVKWATDPLDPTLFGEYAWDPVTNTWSQTLGDILGEINTTSIGQTVAWFKALNELILANGPFVWANDYALLHRYKYELKYPV